LVQNVAFWSKFFFSQGDFSKNFPTAKNLWWAIAPFLLSRRHCRKLKGHCALFGEWCLWQSVL